MGEKILATLVPRRSPSSLASAARKLGFPGLFTTFREWENDNSTLGFRHHLERGWQLLDAFAVFCSEGRPTVFFSRTQRKGVGDAMLHRRLWNFAGPALLVVEDDLETQVFSAFATPFGANDQVRREAALVEEPLGKAAFVAELAHFLRSVASGAYYQCHASKFEPKRGIDHHLLTNLCSARDLLCAVESSRPFTRAQSQALLGRCLFVSYLRERGIIDGRDFRASGGSAAETLAEFLRKQNAGGAADSLTNLFCRLDGEFNGSLFGGPGAMGQLLREHINVVTDFLGGFDFALGQPLLPGFPAYDFGVIPIELISAIYEEFIGADHEATPAAEDDDSDDHENTRQEKLGAYYTPPQLAELVVDIASDHRAGLLGQRCLDPSCGSGIFLVVLFQRMAAEWFSRHAPSHKIKSKARLAEMAREFRKILSEKLCGVDCDSDACHVACFSLYLAYLDQFPEPRRIRDVSKLLLGEPVLPKIYFDAEDSTTASLPLPKGGIIHGNFFSPRIADLCGFDIVVGNPPWTGRRQGATYEQRQWLADKIHNPWLDEAGKNKTARTAWFSPNEQVAIGFMWKVPLHLAAGGKACLLLPSRVLFADQTDQFQAAWFERFHVETIWQLADFRRILFKNAICPALVIRFGRVNQTPSTDIRLFSPLAETSDPRRGTIAVTDEDLRLIPNAEVIAEASAGRAAQMWKWRCFTTERDRRIVAELVRYPRLSAITGEADEGKRLRKGQGFQPIGAKDKPKGKVEWRTGTRFLSARSKAINLFLPKDALIDPPKLPDGLRRDPSEKIFTAPMVLVNQGFSKCAFSRHNTVFQHALQSISGESEDEPLLLFLAAVLNTSLPDYFLFHTSANIGIERAKALLSEVVELPFPLPDERNREIFDEVVRLMYAAESALLAAEHFGDRVVVCREWRAKIAPKVFDYYRLSPWQRNVVEESVAVFRKSIQPQKIGALTKAAAAPGDDDLERYVNTLCSTINRWVTHSSMRLVAQVTPLPRDGVALLTLRKRSVSDVQQTKLEIIETPAVFVTTPDARTERLLARISRAARDEKLGCEFLRGFALFTDKEAYVVKRLSYRAWSYTAALNDADELAAAMLNIGPNKT